MKSGSKTSKTGSKSSGGLKYLHEAKKRSVVDGKVQVHEEYVVLGANGFFAKLYVKENDKIEKYEIKSSPSGGEYSMRVLKDGKESKSTMSKSELLESLKKLKSLAFVLDYLKKESSLSRQVGKGKAKSKSKSKKTTTKKSKKSKSKSKSKKY